MVCKEKEISDFCCSHEEKAVQLCKKESSYVSVGSQKISQNLFVKSIDVNYAPVRLFFLL